MHAFNPPLDVEAGTSQWVSSRPVKDTQWNPASKNLENNPVVVVVHIFNPSTQEADFCEFKASVFYKVRSGQPDLLHRETLSRREQQTKKKQPEPDVVAHACMQSQYLGRTMSFRQGQTKR